MTSQAIAVLDIGKTNAKVVLFDAAADREVLARTTPNIIRRDGPYPHADVAALQAFFIDALADVAREAGGALDAISITAHGATGALIGEGGLALPILDYEHDGPDTLGAAYDRVRPPFAETFSPRLPGGLNLGAQLFWQAATFPEEFGRARSFLPYPQFWAWWLTGISASEPTSLGAHSDLWAPREKHFSSLVASAGWTDLMAPLRSAFDMLGPLRPELAARIGLTRPVPVACGIHDSNASLLPYLQGGGAPPSIVSTGTWAIAFAVGGSIETLDPVRDMLANVDAYGRPTPSARFMGGREFDILTRKEAGEPDPASVRAMLERQVMALPTFAPGNGPFPRGPGRWTHDPASLSRGERTAVASLYVALMTATCLDLLEARGTIVVEGPFAKNALYREALAARTGTPVLAAAGGTGTSAGAARLALPPGPARPLPPAVPDRFDLGPAFAAYAARWRREAGA